MKNTCLKLLVFHLAVSSFVASTYADVVNPFYSMKQFNTVVFGNLTYTNGTDNMGSMAVGGNIVGKSGGLGVATNGGSGPGNASLVVGGNVNVSSGQIYSGDYYIGGSSPNTPQFNLGSGTRLETCPVDFTAMQNELRSTSAALVGMGVDTTPVSNTWNTQFNVTAGTLNILNVNAADLKNGSLASLQLNGMDATTQVVINIIGDSNYNTLTMQYGESQGSNSWGNNVMINLVDIEELNVTGHGQNNFSILAVDTDINATYTNFEGLVVANNVTLTGAEFHDGRPFEPEINLPGDPTQPAATPEPGTAMIFLLGMAGLPIYCRFRKRQNA